MNDIIISRRTALKTAFAGLGAAALGGIAGCGSDGASGSDGSASATLTVAASPSPHAEILNDFAAPRLADQGIELVVKEYTDYIIPNQVTSSGEVDANYFQHINYLNNYNEENGTDLVNAGSIHFEPMGVFAGKSDDIEAVADGAKISVPNDPTNEGRALLLLQDLGLITLSEDAGITATKNDIVDNPKNLDIVEQEAAMLPSTLADSDFAVINGNYAIDAGLSLKDAVASEDPQSDVIQQEYANIICTSADKADDERIAALVDVLTTDEFRTYLDETFDGSVLPAF
ncbi:MetQ/NlpA family ABC transporter substrate-binding protein [Candidatus Collinsella stercoripullorum]|uniref:MetQ/NlpA family ABC transporter substrate-binding protein n=1 Tax=Candidatus Collinsella stercoripullorum TaxID=2838522 RepID=UPI0022DF2F6F|nr:MetQ/NlpA family ABC transporter substrate-binding protein [Candidatus Collinsella stercoripullorum]